MTPVLFLDRDGVINADSRRFIKSVAEWKPLPGSLEAIARLSQAGYRIVVITNQSGIARGLLDEQTLAEIHEAMTRQIAGAGGQLAGIYSCPHAPEAGCPCRKPRPGLIERACRELGIDARGVPLVGDRWSDVLAARRAGCRPILVRTGLEVPVGAASEEWRDVPVFRDLAEVATALLAEAARDA